MKAIKYILFISMFSGGLFSCHDLEVPISTQLTPDIFPQTPEQFVAAAGPT